MVQETISTRGAGVVLDEARHLHGLKKYREAIEKLKGIVEADSKTGCAIDSAYNIAFGYALLGEKKNALDWLEKAVQMGWKDVAHLEEDSDLESLRDETRYKKLTVNLRAKQADGGSQSVPPGEPFVGRLQLRTTNLTPPGSNGRS